MNLGTNQVAAKTDKAGGVVRGGGRYEAGKDIEGDILTQVRFCLPTKDSNTDSVGDEFT